MVVPRRAVRQLRRDMLAEQARDVLARRRQRVVERRGDQHLDDRLPRPAVRARVEIGALHVGEARRDDDAGGVMLGELAARQAGEIRQLGKRDVHAERAGAAAPVRDALDEMPAGSAAGSISALIEQLRIEVGDDRARADVSPVSVTTPTARPFSTMTSRTGASTRISTPCAAAALRHRLRDRAHAADGVAPGALLAVHLAEAVVQQHVGRARRVGARVVADDAVEAVGRLDRIALEPAVEIVAGRVREQVEQLALQVERRAGAAGWRCGRT